MTEYIDKQAAIDALGEEPEVCTTDNEWDMGAQEQWRFDHVAIEAIPPADVRPVVRGEWKHLGGDEWCCDQFGHVISTEGSWEHPLNDRSIFFCEHCGADMRGGDSE